MSQDDRRPLEGSRSLILGGSSGIGLATAKVAAKLGSTVILVARSRRRLEAALKTIPAGRGIAIAMDATDMSSVEAGLKITGGIDHLVLSVGRAGHPIAPFSRTPLAAARQTFEDHYWASVQVLHASIPHIAVQPSSSITFVTGGLSRRPIRGKAFSTSYQLALEGLGQALIDELAPIRINTVAPGLLKTPLWDDLEDQDRRLLFKNGSGENPVGFVPTADPVGQAIADLMANPYVSGATLSVDGGWARSRQQ